MKIKGLKDYPTNGQQQGNAFVGHRWADKFSVVSGHPEQWNMLDYLPSRMLLFAPLPNETERLSTMHLLGFSNICIIQFLPFT